MKYLLAGACALLAALPGFAENIPLKSYGQQLVDEALIRNPDILVMALHSNLPHGAGIGIVASNIGRYGKKADADDMRVIDTGKPNLELAHGNSRFEVESALKDVSGDTIGAVGIVFRYHAGVDRPALQRRAEAIRDALARHITNADNLLEQYPWDPAATTKTHAQKLVDATMARHPHLLIMALHVRPPGAPANIILASSIGRIGKKADADDMKVIDTGKPLLEVNAATHRRFEVEIALQDASGRHIGALSTVFAYRAGDDRAAFLKRAEAIRDELRGQIPSLASLAVLDP
ncbi:MAG TPA: hypothetical protein VMV25_11285 [Steroidobacteraceae bacterium]|nr:hypothetical protein [Steroidobacteraceae bacterium]